jgi:hypothetical protein
VVPSPNGKRACFLVFSGYFSKPFSCDRRTDAFVKSFFEIFSLSTAVRFQFPEFSFIYKKTTAWFETPQAPTAPSVAELPSTPKIKQQSSITNSHSETGNFHIKSMPKCGKFGAASTAGWGAGAAIFSPVGRVVLLQKGGYPPSNPPTTFWKDSSPRCNRFTASRRIY